MCFEKNEPFFLHWPMLWHVFSACSIVCSVLRLHFHLWTHLHCPSVMQNRHQMLRLLILLFLIVVTPFFFSIMLNCSLILMVPGMLTTGRPKPMTSFWGFSEPKRLETFPDFQKSLYFFFFFSLGLEPSFLSPQLISLDLIGQLPHPQHVLVKKTQII